MRKKITILIETEENKERIVNYVERFCKDNFQKEPEIIVENEQGENPKEV